MHEHDLTKEEMTRLTALDRAISSGAGNVYTDELQLIVSADKILEASKKFEEYLKGTITNV